MATPPDFKPDQDLGIPTSSGLKVSESFAKLLNEWARRVAWLGRLDAVPPLLMEEDAAGRRLSVKLPPEIWGLLSGAGNPYSFTRKVPTASGFATAPDNYTGTNAYESKNLGGLAGKIVKLYYQPESNDWRFQWLGLGPPPCSGLTRICATVNTSNCTTNVPVPGATVTVKQGTTTIGTATTDSTGVACIVVPAAGVYTVTATNACGTATGSASVTCNTDNTVTLAVPGPNLTINFTAPDCGGTVSGSATITGTGYTRTQAFFAGSVGFCVPNSGSYTLSYTGNACFQPTTTTIAVSSCTQTFTVPVSAKVYNLTGSVSGCQPVLAGATVSVTGAAGVGGGTTDASGRFGPIPLKANCTFTITVSKGSRFATYTSTQTMPCSDNDLVIGLSPAPGYGCFCTCQTPIKTKVVGGSTWPALQISDSVGVHSLLQGIGAGYTDCIIKPSQSVVCLASNSSNCSTGNVTVTANIAYNYTLTCQTGIKTIRLSRFQLVCFDSLGNPHPIPGQCGTGTDVDSAPNPASCGALLTGFQCPEGSELSISEDPGPQTIDANCGPLSLTFNFSFGFADSVTLSEEP